LDLNTLHHHRAAPGRPIAPRLRAAASRPLGAGIILLLALAVALGGCRKPRERALTKDQQRQIEEAILAEAPTPQIPIGATFDDRVRLIGVDVDRPQIAPGQSLKVTWYWESLAAAPGGWKVFVHFEGSGRRNIHDHHPIGELYPIARWEPGQIIRYELTIPVPNDYPVGTAHLYAGVFEEEAWRERKQNLRMEIVNAPEVRTTVHPDGRLEVARVQVGGTGAGGVAPSAPSPPQQSYTAFRAGGPITLDGKLDDEGWRGIPPTRAFVAPDGKPLAAAHRTQARLTWDDDSLYVAFTVPDRDIWNERRGRDARLWEQDAVEIYLDPGANGRDYIEIQVSPTGELFDAHFRSRRTPAWEEAARALHMEGLEAAVDVLGTVNSRDDGVEDERWTVELRIPWRELPGVEAAPVGETWGMNLYRINVGGEDFMAAWTPVGGDFHNVEAFGRVTFSAATRGSRRQVVPASPPASHERGEAEEGAGGATHGAPPGRLLDRAPRRVGGEAPGGAPPAGGERIEPDRAVPSPAGEEPAEAPAGGAP